MLCICGPKFAARPVVIPLQHQEKFVPVHPNQDTDNPDQIAFQKMVFFLLILENC